jgi:hypothetical protein
MNYKRKFPKMSNNGFIMKMRILIQGAGNMNWKTSAFLAALAFVLAATLPFAVEAREPEPPRQLTLPSKLSELEERQIYIDRGKTFVNLHSIQESEESSLWFDFSLSTEYDLEISMSYGGSNIDEKESQELLLKFIGIAEYEDTNGNGLYDIYSDRLISKYPLSGSYFSSDLAEREGDYEDLEPDEDVEEIIEQFEEFQFAEGYNFGFDIGFDLGLEKGIRDKEDGTTPVPFLDEILDPTLLKILLAIPWEAYKDDFNGDNDVEIPPGDVIYVYYRAYAMGMDSGFTKGYEYGYHEEDGSDPRDPTRSGDPDQVTPNNKEAGTVKAQEEDSSLTASNIDRSTGVNLNNLIDFLPGEIKEGLSPNHPTYQKINVERVDLDEESYEVRFSVMDSKNRFGIACTVVNEFSWVDNGYLSPGSLKVDLMMNNYSYRKNGTDLALLMDTGMIADSSKEVLFDNEEDSWDETIDLATDEAMIRISTEGFSGFFSWATTAEADGKDVDVKYSDHPSFLGTEWEYWDGHLQHFKGVIFSYPRAETIHHDPKLGFIEIGDENIYNVTPEKISRILHGSLPVFVITSVLVAAAVAVTWKRRGR